MRRILRKVVSFIFILVGLVWKFLDFVGRGDTFMSLGETLDHVGALLAMHQETGYQIAPWFFMVAGAVSLVLLQRPESAFRQKKEASKAEPSITRPPEAQQEPKTLREYFESEFSDCTAQFNNAEIFAADRVNKITIPWRIHLDEKSGTKFISFYVPYSNDMHHSCAVISDLPNAILEHSKGIVTVTHPPGESSHSNSKHFVFSGRIYIYFEGILSLQELGSLEALYKSKNLVPMFRGHEFPIGRWLQEKASAV